MMDEHFHHHILDNNGHPFIPVLNGCEVERIEIGGYDLSGADILAEAECDALIGLTESNSHEAERL